MKKLVIGGALVASLCASVYASITCTYNQGGGSSSCNTDNQCATYKDRVAVTCTDGGTATGKMPAAIEENRVEINTMSGGTCSNGHCTGGTVFEIETVTLEDQPCGDCGG